MIDLWYNTIYRNYSYLLENVMQKKVLQDIHTPNDNDNMQKERLSRKWDYGGGDGITKRGSEESTSQQSTHEDSGAYTQPYKESGRSKRRDPLGIGTMWWGAGGLLLALMLFVVVWSFFSTATVKVVLSQQTTTINDTFTAVRGVTEEGGVSYQIVKLQEKATADVSPTGEDEVVRKASGQIIVYSEHGDNLRFVVNTRFQSPDGKIYRVDKPITIPGAKKDADGELVPGSVEITVYADEPGEEYNMGLADFTVPGLFGSDLYEKFYARSKTEMMDGFDGVLKYASEEDVENASLALREDLREKLLTGISGSISEERILFDDSIFIDFSTHVSTDVSANGMLTIEETGLLQAFVFDKKELSGAIADNSLSSFNDSPVLVKNLDEMNFVFENKDEFDINVSDSFTFALSGNPHIIWEVDTVALKNDLAGLSENDISSIIKDHSSIRKIETSIKPFWKSSFPDNPEAIVVEEVLE